MEGWPKKYGMFIIMLVVSFYGYTYYHELAHQQIYEHFEVDSSLTMNLKGGYVEPDMSDWNRLDAADQRLLKALQLQNEFVGYHFMVVLGMMMVIAFLIFQWKE